MNEQKTLNANCLHTFEYICILYNLKKTSVQGIFCFDSAGIKTLKEV